MGERYILDGHNPVVEDDLLKWGAWMQTGNCRVALDQVTPDVKVSTVFLGLDHSFGGFGPILFETMIFGGEHDGYQDRYMSWEDAEEGHKKAVAMVKS